MTQPRKWKAIFDFSLASACACATHRRVTVEWRIMRNQALIGALIKPHAKMLEKSSKHAE